MIGPLGTEPDARSIVQPEAAPFRLLGGYSQPFPAPDAHHATMTHLPALIFEQRMNASVSVAPILSGQPNNVASEDGFVRPRLRLIANC